MGEKICKHCGCVLTNEPEYKCYKNPDRTLAEKIIREDIINCTDWEIGAEETIANGMLKFHDQVSSQFEPPVKPACERKLIISIKNDTVLFDNLNDFKPLEFVGILHNAVSTADVLYKTKVMQMVEKASKSV